MKDDRYSRQTFLGPSSQEKICNAYIGVVGLGGGGSHIVQQLAYIGFRNFVLYDQDVIELSNLNRTVNATLQDITEQNSKIDISIRTIYSLHPDAKVNRYKKRWQEQPELLRGCDLIFGCIDGFAERGELEICARRYMIPYIDIGIDVHEIKPQPPVMSGQVIASIPGGPCLYCLGFLTLEKLSKEAAKYGAAGKNPQVVWANGVVASTAVGIGIDLLTGWTGAGQKNIYLMYIGNEGVVKPHPRLKLLENWNGCLHFPDKFVGDPHLKQL